MRVSQYLHLALVRGLVLFYNLREGIELFVSGKLRWYHPDMCGPREIISEMWQVNVCKENVVLLGLLKASLLKLDSTMFSHKRIFSSHVG